MPSSACILGAVSPWRCFYRQIVGKADSETHLCRKREQPKLRSSRVQKVRLREFFLGWNDRQAYIKRAASKPSFSHNQLAVAAFELKNRIMDLAFKGTAVFSAQLIVDRHTPSRYQCGDDQANRLPIVAHGNRIHRQFAFIEVFGTIIGSAFQIQQSHHAELPRAAQSGRA